MLYHPPLLYLGLVTTAVPAALAVAGLVRRSLDRSWLTLVRRWTGVAWVLLTVGMLAGAHWAYVELGWGGFWAWDPVENAALLPWLVATAGLHAAMVDQHRSSVRPSTVALVLGTALAALVGTLLTRSGAVSRSTPSPRRPPWAGPCWPWWSPPPPRRSPCWCGAGRVITTRLRRRRLRHRQAPGGCTGAGSWASTPPFSSEWLWWWPSAPCSPWGRSWPAAGPWR